MDDRATRLLRGRLYDELARRERPSAGQALSAAARWLRGHVEEGVNASAPHDRAAFVAYERR